VALEPLLSSNQEDSDQVKNERRSRKRFFFVEKLFDEYSL